MAALTSASSNCKGQTRPLVREDVTHRLPITVSVQLRKEKDTGRGYQGAWRQVTVKPPSQSNSDSDSLEVECSVESWAVKRRLGGWCEMAASLGASQLKGRLRLSSEADEQPLLEPLPGNYK
jgi:hypothetical protein